MSEALQTIGANQPPVQDQLAIRVDELVATANLWINEVPEIKDEATANAARDFVEQLARERNAVEEERVRQAKPLRALLQAVQDTFLPMHEKLDASASAIKNKLTGWINAEKKRLDEERLKKEAEAREAEKQAAQALFDAEAEDATVEDRLAAQQKLRDFETARQEANAAQVAKPLIQGNMASRALGGRTIWSAVVNDWQLAASHYATDAGVREAIQKAANRDAKAQKSGFSVPGCKVKSETVI